MTSAVLFVVPQYVASEQDHRVVLSAATLTRKGIATRLCDLSAYLTLVDLPVAAPSP